MQRVDASFENCFDSFVSRFAELFNSCAYCSASASLSFLHLFAKPRQHFHVALAALDFLVENHAIESFAAFGQFFRQIEMRARDKTEAM